MNGIQWLHVTCSTSCEFKGRGVKTLALSFPEL
jgi:hypothetical protein